MSENYLKNFTKKIPLLWKVLTSVKDFIVYLSRLKDVIMMLLSLHIYPKKTFKFSTRKLLPCDKNKFSKNSKPIIPYDLLEDKSSEISKMKEINIVARGSSFDLNQLKNLKGPIFCVSFYNGFKIDNNGKVVYRDHFNHETGEREIKKTDDHITEKEYLTYESYEDFRKNDLIYVQSTPGVLEMFKKKGLQTLSLDVLTLDKDGNHISKDEKKTNALKNIIDNDQCKLITTLEKIYKPPILPPYPNFTPASSFIPSVCSLSFFAEKMNIYGWDHHFTHSPEKMSYIKFLFFMLKYELKATPNSKFKWNAHFESLLINIYYGYQFSKLPNINVFGYLGRLEKHKKIVKKIERVLFN
tara:strand:- start:14 stop:1078 length:1065 start_codon:yes stop_codon:yes gene_type:complete